jgi:hypothetical protein
VFFVGTFDHGHAGAAVAVVQPDFARAFSSRKSSRVNWRASLPSACMIQTLSPPPASLM